MTTPGGSWNTDADGSGEPTRTPGYRAWISGLVELAQQAFRRLTVSAARTPGRLSMIAAGLVTLTLLVGLVSTVMAQGKKDAVDGLLEHREPVTAEAQRVYSALSDAEATAAAALLAEESETERLRERYEDSIAQAGASLAKASASAQDVPAAAEQVDIIGQQLPVYTGLVETARANDRQGFPVGASYLQEASELMRSAILPAAEELYELETDRLAEQQRDARSVPVFTALLALGLVAALLATQRYLRRRTNRVLNPGLVVATVAVLVGLLWTSVALVVHGVQVGSGQRDGTEQADRLVSTRIVALQARADQTMSLVARGDGDRHTEGFSKLSRQLGGSDGAGGLLGEVREQAAGGPAEELVNEAIENSESWRRADERIREHSDEGDYGAAVELAISGDDEGAAQAFHALDDNLSQAIAEGRQDFVDSTTTASRALHALPQGLAVLSVVAALGITVGVGERLREYR
ncbi:hypothetical protein SAMN06265360_105122 [Haloechinothrix alba]|uniref:Secreted protein n=1 Tax=Haloechinothrix alba TaxID=664784 RepID=A0A238W4X9_9PSEU|nr:hypothetical protein [Haloechinothrix alba]SNR41596.1 hypothetical protein SAMN06265360_105122 [Haloechinothrix alba]